ncbi:MAG: microcin ABC transporter ATP-binding protein [Gammaproteobacteria bacterium]|nr:MAG: microcin ABC transporter ATP-binding protein [Gammaproteobacteria bacterium]
MSRDTRDDTLHDTQRSTERLLELSELSVAFGAGSVPVVEEVSLTIDKGETVALVGESGSGKSVTALSILQLLPRPLTEYRAGSIRWRGEELLGAPDGLLRQVRGNEISMIFQEPMTSLNPLHTIEKQIGESLRLHRGLRGKAARARTLELLDHVGIHHARKRLGAYPHELSGGQRQRVMIAMALANEPELLIADEPTTALDVTIQAQILELLNTLRDELGMALLLITHDLGVVHHMADRIHVMRRGRVVEAAPTERLFSRPEHPYTQALLSAEPGDPPVRNSGETPPTLLAAQSLRVRFPVRKSFFGRAREYLDAVDDVSLEVPRGRTLGIVGESGSGKTTLGLALLRLIPSSGSIVFQGSPIHERSSSSLRSLRQSLQIVFQDPFGSLSPRMTIGQIVAEGLTVHRPGMSKIERRDAVSAALADVGLDDGALERFPHEFSGGQRQRISIARALVLRPSLIVLDEPTSALDMSVQSQIVNLLQDLQARFDITYLFISHDLKVVRAMSDRIVVMRQGRIVEEGEARQVLEHPRDDYTRALMAAAFDQVSLRVTAE